MGNVHVNLILAIQAGLTENFEHQRQSAWERVDTNMIFLFLLVCLAYMTHVTPSLSKTRKEGPGACIMGHSR